MKTGKKTKLKKRPSEPSSYIVFWKEGICLDYPPLKKGLGGENVKRTYYNPLPNRTKKKGRKVLSQTNNPGQGSVSGMWRDLNNKLEESKRGKKERE